MELIIVGLLIVVVVLAGAIVRLLTRQDPHTQALEAQIGHVQRELQELNRHSSTRQAESRSLAARLNDVQMGITELRAHVEARSATERQTMESIRRLEAVIAGTQSKGSAGENILEAVFAQLPAAWQLRDYRVGDKMVEFGLRLPNDLVLPVDSKWTATHLVEQIAATDDLAERRHIKTQIERAVLRKAREVRKYIHPSITTTFAVAVIPDAVYDHCAGIQAEVFSMNVVLLNYSLFVPYLLLVFQTALKSSHSVDVQKLEAFLQAVDEQLDAMQSEIEGRFSRAIRMMTNTRSAMRTHITQVKGGLSGIQVSAQSAFPGEEGRYVRRLPDEAVGGEDEEILNY